jgi:hypothetical protein
MPLFYWVSPSASSDNRVIPSSPLQQQDDRPQVEDLDRVVVL